MEKLFFKPTRFKSSIYTLFSIIMLVFFTGCAGDRGPAGPEGPEGPPGAEILPVSFEFTASLTTENDFEFFQDIPSEIEVFESDVILVFVLEDVIPDDDTEVWRQLPLTEFNERGTRLFNFDFTFADVRLFLDANYELDSTDEFVDVLFRGVHVPADFVADFQTASQLKNAKTVDHLELILDAKIEIVRRAETRKPLTTNP